MTTKPPPNSVTTPRGRQKQADGSKRTPNSGDEQGSPSQHQGRSHQRGLKGSVIRLSPWKNNAATGNDASSSSTQTETTSTTTEASEQSIDQYPVTRLVLALEKREQNAQDKYNSLEKRCQELDVALQLSIKEREREASIYGADYRKFKAALNGARKELDKEKAKADEAHTTNESLLRVLAAHASTIETLNAENSEAKAKCESLRAAHDAILEELEAEKHKVQEVNIRTSAYDALLQQLEKEQEKAKELHTANESLAADLAAQTQEKEFAAKMLEEKTYESWIFRCAVAVIYKDSPSKERVKMGKLIRDVLFYLRDKRQRERARQQQQEDSDEDGNGQQQGSGDGQYEEQQEQGQVVESSAPQHEEPTCPETPGGGGDSGHDSEDLPLSGRETRPKRCRTLGSMEYSDYFAASDDSDDEKPLVDVLKKRAKKLRTMASHEEASSD
ncbi:hypothetical protein BBK36DRAFT_1139233 [Trichoderma citrinoviride]|uniref:SWI5-dependent HO expression protein 3 n=1 Tax=Trichoderma citrinoviride TaxID=58853 RepID=A0A2T4BIL2_9HYPO|nr:hypothetical protein BBK36DRAFT_1139233 [Trichoderma citrinoviride]PTB69154.1 hypothetical protein BBK36DRAFT_1139233 [Trichoderma citrinoviride]